MRSVSAALSNALQSRSISIVPFVLLTLRDGTFLRISDQSFVFLDDDYQDWLIQPAPFTQTMNHLPVNSAGQLYREYTFSLRNGTWDEATGQRFSEYLQSAGLLFASVVIGEFTVRQADLSITLGLTERERIQRLTSSDTVEIFYRGEITSVGPIDNDRIICDCTSFTPRGGTDSGYVSDGNSSQDGVFDGVGRRHNVVYGRLVEKVPMLPVVVGALSSLAGDLDVDAEGSLSVTDITGFPASGTIMVAGEVMQYASVSANALIGLTRDDFLRTDHKAGDTVAVIPTIITFSAAANASDIVAVYARNPLNNELLRVTTSYISTPQDATTILGQLFSSVSWTGDQWLSLLTAWVANARQTEQPIYVDAASSVLTDTTTVTTSGSSQFQDQARADDGDWTSGNSEWTWAAIEQQEPKELIRQNHSGTLDPLRPIVRFRALVQIDPQSFDVGLQEAIFLLDYSNSAIPGASSETYFPGQVTTGARVLYGPWVNTNPATVTAADFDSGTYEFGFSQITSTEPDAAASYVAEVDLIGIEYEYLDASAVLDQLVPAAIEAQSGGVGVELYADVRGPITPEIYGAGYDMEDAPWIPGGTVDGSPDASHTQYVDNVTSQLVRSINPPVIDLPLINDATNWTAGTGSSGGIIGDAIIGGRECYRFGPFSPGTMIRDRVVALDWSSNPQSQAGVDVYVESSQLANVDFFQFRIGTGVAPDSNYISYQVDVDGGMSADVWTIFGFDLTGAPLGSNDPDHSATVGTPDLSDVTRIQLRVTSTVTAPAGSHPISFSRIRGDFTDISQISIVNTNVTAADMTAVGDLYKIRARVKNITSSRRVAIWFSNGVLPTDPYVQVIFDPRNLPDDKIVEFDALGADIGGVPAINAINDFAVIMNTLASGESMIDDEIEVYSVVPSLGVDPDYIAAIDEPLESPVDVARHFLEQRSDIGAGVIDNASFAQAAIDLAAQKVSAVLSELGADDVTVLDSLGMNHRFQLAQRDTNTATEYQIFAAQASLDWPTPTTILSEWASITEASVDGLNVVNRRIFIYDRDRSKGTGAEAYRRALIANKDENETSFPTASLEASEVAIGPREAQNPLAFDTAADPATADDSATYYTQEEARLGRVFTLTGVPWVQGYALERGDLIRFTPEWESTAVDARVISVTKDTLTQTVQLDAIEVPTS